MECKQGEDMTSVDELIPIQPYVPTVECEVCGIKYLSGAKVRVCPRCTNEKEPTLEEEVEENIRSYNESNPVEAFL